MSRRPIDEAPWITRNPDGSTTTHGMASDGTQYRIIHQPNMGGWEYVEDVPGVAWEDQD